MELNITQKTKDQLLARTRVIGEVTFESKTPSNEEMKKAIAKAASADENLVVVKRIGTAFGEKKASILALVYDDEASLLAIEPKPKKKAEAVK